MMLIKVISLDGLNEVAEALIHYFNQGYKVVLLTGDLGSGKTTMVKALCQELGVMEPVSSPTFSLIQEYHSPSQGVIYHVDLYRLEHERDLEQIGFNEYLDSGNICLIEWPALGEAHYTMPHLKVVITVNNDNIRNFKITSHDEVDA